MESELADLLRCKICSCGKHGHDVGLNIPKLSHTIKDYIYDVQSQPQTPYLLPTLSADHDHAVRAPTIPSPIEEPIPRESKVDTIKRSDAASLCFNSLQSSGPSMKQQE
jgi:hypothetical protein